MSERALRQENAEILGELLNRFEQEQSTLEKQKQALVLAHSALREEPRHITPCNFLLEFVPFNAVTERAHCSECDGASIGHNEHWKFCPLCGSRIEQVMKETDPRARLIREGVRAISFSLQEN